MTCKVVKMRSLVARVWRSIGSNPEVDDGYFYYMEIDGRNAGSVIRHKDGYHFIPDKKYRDVGIRSCKAVSRKALAALVENQF